MGLVLPDPAIALLAAMEVELSPAHVMQLAGRDQLASRDPHLAEMSGEERSAAVHLHMLCSQSPLSA